MPAFSPTIGKFGDVTARGKPWTLWYKRHRKQFYIIASSILVVLLVVTDWQQPFVIALTQADGVSIVHETVYEERFGYTDALNNMGAKIQLDTKCLGGANCRYAARNYKHSAVITGSTPLIGTELTIPDIRAGFSYVLAALLAEGTTTLHNMQLIQRGYENFADKLASLGADMTVTNS